MASIESMTLDEIHESIWICKKQLYIVSKNEYQMGEFIFQRLNGGTLSWEIGTGTVNEAVKDVKDYLIVNRFFFVCHFKDLDMESMLVERGF